LKELVQRSRIDELAEEHATTTDAEQVDHRLARLSAHGFADDVELHDGDLGVGRLVEHDAIVLQVNNGS
jgi:hypothetical protein